MLRRKAEDAIYPPHHGGQSTLPIQFRFVSSYKFIEMHHRVTANERFDALALPSLPNSTPYILMAAASRTRTNAFPNCGIGERTSDWPGGSDFPT
jgi:hypothetical protein